MRSRHSSPDRIECTRPLIERAELKALEGWPSAAPRASPEVAPAVEQPALVTDSGQRQRAAQSAMELNSSQAADLAPRAQQTSAARQVALPGPVYRWEPWARHGLSLLDQQASVQRALALSSVEVGYPGRS
jgi:hypothetical protein